MRAIVQRANGADILIETEGSGSISRSIGPGLVVFLGVMAGDTRKEAEYLAGKIPAMRIFKDENGKLNRSLEEEGGEILIVSNFTLSADCKHGRRPSFERAAKGEQAEELYRLFVELVRANPHIRKTETGEFGAHMHVNVENDGPLNIILDTEKREK